jgi:hypothetical protein
MIFNLGMSAVNQSGQKENIAESLKSGRPTQYTLTSNLTRGNPIMVGNLILI